VAEGAVFIRGRFVAGFPVARFMGAFFATRVAVTFLGLGFAVVDFVFVLSF